MTFKSRMDKYISGVYSQWYTIQQWELKSLQPHRTNLKNMLINSLTMFMRFDYHKSGTFFSNCPLYFFCQLKKKKVHSMRFRFYLGQNWRPYPGRQHFRIALRTCSKEVVGGRLIISGFGEGGIHAIKHIFLQKDSASHEEQTSPWRNLVLF